MAAAVSTRLNDSMGKPSMSPQTKKATIKTEDKPQTVPSIVQPDDKKPDVSSDKKDIVAPPANAPLAPPPRPSEVSHGNNREHSGPNGQKEGKDYFSKEPNPFENAFGAPSETPGKPQLPGVTSLTSPAPLLGGATPGWPGSLRSGPLSPAMLTGPTNNDYFSGDHHFAGSFPTPNESSLRTGLTPGGGGSMFPQPSPNSQAMFNAIQNGGATPGTLDFHRTAMHARAANQATAPTSNSFGMQPSTATSQPQNPNIHPALANAGNNNNNHEQHDANDAANGLYMLAKATNAGPPQNQQFQPPPPPLQTGYAPASQMVPINRPADANGVNKRGAKGSIGSIISSSTQNGDEHHSDSASGDQKPAKGRGKKAPAAKGAKARKAADDTPAKSNKRQKGNSGAANMPPPDADEDDSEPEDLDHDAETGRKLTDEEKRKNFLERNRIAALKCRQRKKQWLANLQHKVEIYSTENDALAATVTQLREEIVGLKTLLLAHKDCPVSQAQGISGLAMQNIAGDAQQYGNPYQMGMAGMGQHGMPPQANMQRR